jgi:hypothetical protein
VRSDELVAQAASAKMTDTSKLRATRGEKNERFICGPSPYLSPQIQRQ